MFGLRIRQKFRTETHPLPSRAAHAKPEKKEDIIVIEDGKTETSSSSSTPIVAVPIPPVPEKNKIRVAGIFMRKKTEESFM